MQKRRHGRGAECRCHSLQNLQEDLQVVSRRGQHHGVSRSWHASWPPRGVLWWVHRSDFALPPPGDTSKCLGRLAGWFSQQPVDAAGGSVLLIGNSWRCTVGKDWGETRFKMAENQLLLATSRALGDREAAWITSRTTDLALMLCC